MRYYNDCLGKIIPAIHVLMKHKTRDAYKDLFLVLFLLVKQFNAERGPLKLKRILIDFETAAIKPLRELLAGEFKRHEHIQISSCSFITRRQCCK